MRTSFSREMTSRRLKETGWYTSCQLMANGCKLVSLLLSQTYLQTQTQQHTSMLTTKSCKKLWQGRKLTSSCVQALVRKLILARFLQRLLSLQTTLDSSEQNSYLTTTQSSKLTKQYQARCLQLEIQSTLSLKMASSGFTETETLALSLQLLEHMVHGLTKKGMLMIHGV